MRSILLPPDFLNHFKITDYKQAAPGGQKTVFIVTIEAKKYALKVIRVADERLEREVKICEQFSHHSGIPSIIEIQEFDGNTVILEEYIDGHDLSELIDDYIGNEVAVLELLHRIGTILKPIWEGRYIHRDLKPQNIRIKSDGHPVVLDFGIARALDDETITAAGEQPLSWYYASPEQYDGKKDMISYRTDFFCLAILGYRLFTGKLPFGTTKDEIRIAFRKPLLKCNSGSSRIDSFCDSMFHLSPSSRPRKIDTYLYLTQL